MKEIPWEKLPSNVKRLLLLLTLLCDIILKQSYDSMNQMVEAVLEDELQRAGTTKSLEWAYGRIARLLPLVQLLIELELDELDHDG